MSDFLEESVDELIQRVLERYAIDAPSLHTELMQVLVKHIEKAEPRVVLPDPADYFGTEYLPVHANFVDFVAAINEQEEKKP